MPDLQLRIGTAKEFADLADDLAQASRQRSHLWMDNDQRTVAISYDYDGRFWVEFPGSAVFGHSPSETDVWTYIQEPLTAPLVRDMFERSVLPIMLHLHGIEALHASAVKAARGVVAFCGKSHTGKSTIARGLTQHGFRILADDAVAFRSDMTGVSVLPLPFQTHLRKESLEYFSGIDPYRDPTPRYRKARALPLTLLAVFLLDMNQVKTTEGADVLIEELRGSEALLGLLEHAYATNALDVKRKAALFDQYSDAVNQTNIFRLNYSAGFAHFPALLDKIVSTIDKMSPKSL